MPLRGNHLLTSAFIALGLLASCGSEPSAPAVEAPPTPIAVSVGEPTPGVVVSDAVPTMEELLETGLTESEAECFITTIDPDSTGKVESAELFVEALNCI